MRPRTHLITSLQYFVFATAIIIHISSQSAFLNFAEFQVLSSVSLASHILTNLKVSSAVSQACCPRAHPDMERTLKYLAFPRAFLFFVFIFACLLACFLLAPKDSTNTSTSHPFLPSSLINHFPLVSGQIFNVCRLNKAFRRCTR